MIMHRGERAAAAGLAGGHGERGRNLAGALRGALSYPPLPPAAWLTPPTPPLRTADGVGPEHGGSPTLRPEKKLMTRPGEGVAGGGGKTERPKGKGDTPMPTPHHLCTRLGPRSGTVETAARPAQRI